MVLYGVYQRASWQDYPELNDSIFSFHIVGDSSWTNTFKQVNNVAFNWWDNWSLVTGKKAKWTDNTWINSRFTRANTEKNRYEYAMVFMQEEMFSPISLTSWAEPLRYWILDGYITTPNGYNFPLIKTWIETVKGEVWNQSWWDALVFKNNSSPMDMTYMNDSKLREWNDNHSYSLHKAWHEWIRSLGKKSMLVASVLKYTNTWETSFYWQLGRAAGDYILQNYDMIGTYNYPTTISEIQSTSLAQVSGIRAKGYKGKINHLLTCEWKSLHFTWTKELATAEYNTILPYVDIIAITPYIDNYERTRKYYPEFIQIIANTCPQVNVTTSISL